MSTQLPMDFDGVTYEPERDQARLTTQMGRVAHVLRSGRWYTLAQLAALAGCASEAGVSARLRDLRKERFGGFAIGRRRVTDGVNEYAIADADIARFRAVWS